jgi:predicted N-formylglutamate amidohydrolase
MTDDTDPAPFSLLNPDGDAPVVLICDHASHAVPRDLAGLGIAREALLQHIGWDIGAADVVGHLARLLDAPAVLSGVSRLVIDCNRALDNPTSIPPESDGVPIPGNRGLDEAARRARAAAWYRPYHEAVAATIARCRAACPAPAILSVHSFTPTMGGFVRPWQVGVLWGHDDRIPTPLLAALRAEGDLCVGDNEPYSARDNVGSSMERHAEREGLPHALIELRQDLIATSEGARAWAERLARLLRPILADRTLFQARGAAVAAS